MKLENAVKNFLENVSNGPFLLALSGGPDSMALFHLFLNSGVHFQVAHVNHNWRLESGQEAQILLDQCLRNNLTFHCHEIFPENLQGNLEDLCRQERLQFFKKIVCEQSLCGVVTGHHGDDQAETVLKRLFEGASLSRLKGLSISSLYDGMKIFRPLLTVRKKEILEWLNKHGHTYFHDVTNDNPLYLRTRLRKEIFPQISSHFGKEIVPSLVRISQASAELEEFLDHFLASFRKKIVKIEDQISLDLANDNIETVFAWKAIIKDFFSIADLILSQPTLEMVIYLLQKGQGKKELIIADRLAIISKKNITIIPKRGS